MAGKKERPVEKLVASMNVRGVDHYHDGGFDHRGNPTLTVSAVRAKGYLATERLPRGFEPKWVRLTLLSVG